ncbi:MAG TPA: helix-turn-helix domain-containing protein [Bacillota bacterium]|nr:helix-turn-helix domain-containing protein [Bacillota bacterium]
MGFKEKMMESMMGKMSAEEKSAMMEKMMDQFFGNMTAEEKQTMMSTMMPKMMGQMMGDGSFMSNMMGNMMGDGSMMNRMMNSMCGGNDDDPSDGFNPMEMCKKMMSSINQSNELATFATPEIRGLFEEWVGQLDNEVLDFVKKTKSTNPDELAVHLKISKDSAVYLLSRLAQKGVISFSVQYQGVV